MEVGYFAVGIGPAADPEWVRTVATNAERLGFSTVWAPEHVVLLDDYTSKYPYSSGKFPRRLMFRLPTRSQPWPMPLPARAGSDWLRVFVLFRSTTLSYWRRPSQQSTA